MITDLLTIAEPNWDKWREQYDTLTFKEHQLFYDVLESLYPSQKHFNLEAARKVFEIVKPVKVFEAGGWKGELCLQMRNENEQIWIWRICELCRMAVENTVLPEKYLRGTPLWVGNMYDVPFRFDWWENYSMLTYDLFLATHFIEHLSDAHLTSLITKLKPFPYVYFESPLTNEGQDWKGYKGTHKLNMGWNAVVALMKENGFELILDNGDCKLFKRL